MTARFPWPLPAVLAWSACWGVNLLAQRLGLPTAAALLLAALPGLLPSLWVGTWWRRLIIAGGFPLSLLASGAPVPGWVWLGLLGMVLLVYPIKAWRDAPLFPTPPDALRDLPGKLALPANASVLDAGCGLGDGLLALRRAFPLAQLHGLEWSWPLRALCGLRCPWAKVRHGDIWQADWRPHALVYLFQRPETMPRAVRKASAEMAEASWLVSLEFEAGDLLPDARCDLPDGRSVWLYRLPFTWQPERTGAKDEAEALAGRRKSS